MDITDTRRTAILWLPNGSDWTTHIAKELLYEETRASLRAFTTPNVPVFTRSYDPSQGVDYALRQTDLANREATMELNRRRGDGNVVTVYHTAAILVPSLNHETDARLFQNTAKATMYAEGRRKFVRFILVVPTGYMSRDALGEILQFWSGQRSQPEGGDVSLATCSRDWVDIVELYLRRTPPYAES
jgi:hypothetical protein